MIENEAPRPPQKQWRTRDQILLHKILGPSAPTMLLFVALFNGASGSNLFHKFGRLKMFKFIKGLIDGIKKFFSGIFKKKAPPAEKK